MQATLSIADADDDQDEDEERCDGMVQSKFKVS